MKVVGKGSDLKKVTDVEAAVLVKAGWAYRTKSEYKKAFPEKKGPATTPKGKAYKNGYK